MAEAKRQPHRAAAKLPIETQDLRLNTHLPSLHLTITPARLFHPQTGWFVEGPNTRPGDWKKTGANYWTRDRHPAQVDLLLPDGTKVFSGTVDFRLFGGMSRMHPQKSFSLSAKKKYGAPRINYPIFGPDGPSSFKFLVARNAGSDWGRAYLRDPLLQDLLGDPSWELDHQAARPARVFINGRYWGLYHLREKINTTFLAERYGVEDKDDIDLLEGRGEVKNGSRGDYDRFIKFIRRHHPADPAVYREIERQMDVDNFMRLQIAQTYFDNQDAGGNLRYWRDRSDPHSRWRWILYDVDQGFGIHSDTAYRRNTLRMFTDPHGPAWPNPPWSTLLHRKLLENADYRRLFVNRTLDYLATDFRPARVVAKIDRWAGAIAAEIPRHSRRWGRNPAYWPLHVERLREFGRHRPVHLREHLRAHFNGGPDRTVRITVPEGGFVTLNDNIDLEEGAYEHGYFAHFPLHLRAVAQNGYVFTGWADGATTPARAVRLNQGGTYHLAPIFSPVEATAASTAAVEAPAPPPGGSSIAASGPSREQTLLRLSVALIVFVLIALYGSLTRKPE